MRDLLDEIKEKLCEYCDVDGWCLSQNKTCAYLRGYYCQKWQERYDSSVTKKAEYNIKLALHDVHIEEKQ